MNEFFKNSTIVNYVGHGGYGSISGNGFVGESMDWNEVDYDLTSELVVLIACKANDEFGKDLVKKGVGCVVGWDDTLTISVNEGEL